MRLWSIHPKYLDAKGLVAVWREGLLAQSVLLDRTKGYRNHPQLDRFKRQPDPVCALNAYLESIYEESCRRGYCFSEGKLCVEAGTADRMKVTEGQLGYEWKHFLKKAAVRSPERHREFAGIVLPDPHPLFEVEPGDVEGWEKVA